MSVSKKRYGLFFPFLTLLIIAAAVIWVRTSTVGETYHFVQNERRLQTSKQEIQALRLKWTRLTAPPRLANYARELGLEPPRIHQMAKISNINAKTP